MANISILKMCETNQEICFICLKSSMKYIDMELDFTTNKFPLPFSYTYKDCLHWCIRGLGVENIESLCSNRMICVDCGAELQTTFEFLFRIKLAVMDLELSDNLAQETSHSDVESNIIESDDSNAWKEESYIECDFEVAAPTEIENDNYSSNSIDSATIQSQFVIFEPSSEDKPNNDEINDLKATTMSKDDEGLVIERCDNSQDDNSQPNPETKTVYVCTTCKCQFKTHKILLKHNCLAAQKHMMKTHRCKICNKEIPHTESLRNHIKNAHMRIVQCSQCDFKGKELKMKSHELKEHAASEDFTCEQCEKRFSTLSSLKNHLKYHNRKMKVTGSCNICGKCFITPQYLQQHMESHKKERELHQCEYCEKTYVSKKALEMHMRFHTGATMECTVCGKEFSRNYELKVHMRFHTKDFQFKCDICDKQFAIKGHLKSHMWRHQGLKLQCNHCGKLFNTSKALKEHSYTHTQMPFVCSYCFKGYPSKQKYGAHLKTAHLKELNDEELQKANTKSPGQPMQRKKITLVQADSIMKEVEVKCKVENQEGLEAADEKLCS